MPLDWKVRMDVKEVRDKSGFEIEAPRPRVVPSGHYRFALLFYEAGTDVLLGTIEGFRITRDMTSILPPASRGIKSEIYHFVNFSPEWLGLIRDRFKLCVDKLYEENKAEGWLGFQNYEPQSQNPEKSH